MNFLFKINYFYFEESGRQTTCSCQNRGRTNRFTKIHLDRRKNYAEKLRTPGDLRAEKKNIQFSILPHLPPKETPNFSNNKTQPKRPPKTKQFSNNYQKNNLNSWICCRGWTRSGLMCCYAEAIWGPEPATN